MYQPSTDLDTAIARAEMYRRIRSFFSVKQVLEVETPIMSRAAVTDVHLQSISTQFSHKDTAQTGYLHTSPEFAMKRLVAAWKTPIYQITKAFRDNESGKRHNIEFSMLEWYRPEMSLDELAHELAGLLTVLFGKKIIFNRISYQQAFLDYADVEPFSATAEELEQVAMLHGIDSTLSQSREYLSVMAENQPNNTKNRAKPTDDKPLDTNNSLGNIQADDEIITRAESVASLNTFKVNNPYGYTCPEVLDVSDESAVTDKQAVSETTEHTTHSAPTDPTHKAAWLDLLYSQLVEPNLGNELPTLVYDFPAEQAALAKTAVDAEGNLVAKRFELYINGVELANAYDELIDAQIQRQRFDADNATRIEQGLPTMPVDEHLLTALEDMPTCSGISVGLDRLLMVMLNQSDISDVIHFTTPRA